MRPTVQCRTSARQPTASRNVVFRCGVGKLERLLETWYEYPMPPSKWKSQRLLEIFDRNRRLLGGKGEQGDHHCWERNVPIKQKRQPRGKCPKLNFGAPRTQEGLILPHGLFTKSAYVQLVLWSPVVWWFGGKVSARSSPNPNHQSNPPTTGYLTKKGVRPVSSKQKTATSLRWALGSV